MSSIIIAHMLAEGWQAGSDSNPSFVSLVAVIGNTVLQRTLRSQLAWWGSPCAVLVICGTDTGEEAALLHQICNLSISKKTKDNVGYVSFEKYNTAQFFYFNELQCLHLGFSYFVDLKVYGRSFSFLTLQRLVKKIRMF